MRTWLPVIALLAGCGSRDEGAAPGRKAPVEPPPAPAPAATSAVIDAAVAAPEPVAEPPSLPGARLIASADVRWFSVGDELIHWCENGVVRAAPKAGGAPRQVGSCAGAFEVVTDADSIYYCGDRGLVRETGGTDTVLVAGPCLGPEVDDVHVYYLVPGFDDIPDPGVYRVARAGGPAEKLLAGKPHEQYILSLESDALWIGTFGAGTIWRLPKAGGSLAKVVTGQKRLVDLEIDGGWIYWLIEDAQEVRRRPERGGPVEVIGRGVFQEPIAVIDGHAYWFEGAEMQPQRLVHLAPGATEPEPIVDGLVTPSMQVDRDGIYVAMPRPAGIFAFPRDRDRP